MKRRTNATIALLLFLLTSATTPSEAGVVDGSGYTVSATPGDSTNAIANLGSTDQGNAVLNGAGIAVFDWVDDMTFDFSLGGLFFGTVPDTTYTVSGPNLG